MIAIGPKTISVGIHADCPERRRGRAKQSVGVTAESDLIAVSQTKHHPVVGC